jgi:hypothetical protein
VELRKHQWKYIYHSSFRQLKGNALRRLQELTWDAEAVDRGDVGVLRRTAGRQAGRSVRLRLWKGTVKKSIKSCSSALRFRQLYGSHMTCPQHLTLTQAHYGWKEGLLERSYGSKWSVLLLWGSFDFLWYRHAVVFLRQCLYLLSVRTQLVEHCDFQFSSATCFDGDRGGTVVKVLCYK